MSGAGFLLTVWSRRRHRRRRWCLADGACLASTHRFPNVDFEACSSTRSASPAPTQTVGSSTGFRRSNRNDDGTGDVSGNGLHDALEDFLRQANGQPFCDGCLAVELHVDRLDVQHALDGKWAPLDRGHGRCAVCGQTLTVTRALAA